MSLLAIFFLQSAVPERAHAIYPAEFCSCGPCMKKCEKFEDIELLVTTDDALPENGWKMFTIVQKAWDAFREDKSKSNIIYVNSPESLRDGLMAMGSQCKRIRRMLFYGHGSPGSFGCNSCAKGGTILSSANAKTVLGGLDCAMAPGVKIKMDSCNLATGCTGEDFMMELGAMLLKKGGSVTAHKGYGVDSPYLPTSGTTSTNGNVTLSCVGGACKGDGKGLSTVLQGEIPTAQQCYDEIGEIRNKLQKDKDYLDAHCSYPKDLQGVQPKEEANCVASVRNGLLYAQLAQTAEFKRLASSPNRIGYDDKRLAEMPAYHYALSSSEFVDVCWSKLTLTGKCQGLANGSGATSTNVLKAAKEAAATKAKAE